MVALYYYVVEDSELDIEVSEITDGGLQFCGNRSFDDMVQWASMTVSRGLEAWHGWPWWRAVVDRQ